jgi:predicted transposase/invertase (TIGR01784 family)
LPTEHTIKELNFATTEPLGRSPLDRKAIFDVYGIAESGERFIVELQKAKQKFFKDRSLFYASFPIQDQTLKGEWNFKLEAVYTVGILDFVFDNADDSNDFYHLIELKDHNNQVYNPKLKFIYLELPRFEKTSDELETDLEKSVYLFRHLTYMDEAPENLQEGIFAKLFDEAALANLTPKEIRAYEDSLKYYRDMKNTFDTIEEGVTEK